MQNKINFIALAAGISSLTLIAISLFVPWWQFTIGSPANIQVNFSPVNFALSQSGTSFPIPLILALNIACLLTLMAGGIILTIYAIKPAEKYSKQLLGFGYTKPIYSVVAFVVILIVVPIIAQSLAGFGFPISGSAVVTPRGANGSANVSAVLEWPFYFAIVVAGLCIAARVVHGRAVKPTEPSTPMPTQELINP